MGEILREHFRNINMIIKLAKIDLVKTYRAATLGWAWAIIKPSVTIFVYWFTIEIGLRNSSPVNGYPKFLWLIASMIPWFYISEMINSGASSFRSYNYLITKMKFPISVIPTIVNISKFIVHFILIMIVIGLFIFSGYGVDIYLLQLPVYMLLAFLALEAWSLFSAYISSMSVDFLNLVRSVTTVLFWMSGIFWDINNVSNPVIREILWLNPITYIIDGYRNCFINKVFFFEEPHKLINFIISLIIFSLFSVLVSKKYRKQINDCL